MTCFNAYQMVSDPTIQSKLNPLPSPGPLLRYMSGDEDANLIQYIVYLSGA